MGAGSIGCMGSNDLDAYDTVVGWVHQLAPDTAVRWHDLQLAFADAHTHSVDVSVPAFDGLNWLWTIEGETDDFGLMDPTALQVRYDQDLWAVWDSDEHGVIPAAAVSVTGGVPLAAAEVDALEAVIAEHPDRRVLHRSDAWSSAAINRALSEWCRVHAGRNDISFTYDAVAAQASGRALDERISDALAGDTYLIGDNIKVADNVMDILLRLGPDDAAELTQAIRDALEADGLYNDGTPED